jgi:hypothetical protein
MATRVNRFGGMTETPRKKQGAGGRFLEGLLQQTSNFSSGLAAAEIAKKYMGPGGANTPEACIILNLQDPDNTWQWQNGTCTLMPRDPFVGPPAGVPKVGGL